MASAYGAPRAVPGAPELPRGLRIVSDPSEGPESDRAAPDSDWLRACLKAGNPLSHVAGHRQVALALVSLERIAERRRGFLVTTGREQDLGEVAAARFPGS